VGRRGNSAALFVGMAIAGHCVAVDGNRVIPASDVPETRQRRPWPFVAVFANAA
jgi:hypothetical protein